MSLASNLNIIFGGAKYRKSSPYGYRIHPITKKKTFHYGVDYACSKVPLYALGEGVVYKTGYDKSAGNFVYIKHGSVAVAYFHLTSIAVKKGQKVHKGTRIGISGTTGASTGVHLHLGVRNISTWKWQNPETWLNSYTGSSASYKTMKVVTPSGVKVRSGAGTSYAVKSVLSNSTSIKVTETKKVGNEIWVRHSNGWSCAKQGSKTYIK
ncbi:MAG: peptidoglycan DD-metalloendopeptidase family protein [Lentihominibacter sp.]